MSLGRRVKSAAVEGRLSLLGLHHASNPPAGVGSRSVGAAQKRNPNLEGMGHGMAVDQSELEVRELPVFQLEIEHGLQVCGDGFGVVSMAVPAFLL